MLMADYGRALVIVDRAILVVFTLELLLKLFAYRLAFFRSGGITSISSSSSSLGYLRAAHSLFCAPCECSECCGCFRLFRR